MRLKALIVLIALITSILTPVSFGVYSIDNQTTVIVTLDLCSAAGHSLSVNTESAVLYESPSRLVQLMFAGFYDSIDPAFNPFLLAFLSDHPPRV
jgi:hypothetical protein